MWEDTQEAKCIRLKVFCFCFFFFNFGNQFFHVSWRLDLHSYKIMIIDADFKHHCYSAKENVHMEAGAHVFNATFFGGKEWRGMSDSELFVPWLHRQEELEESWPLTHCYVVLTDAFLPMQQGWQYYLLIIRFVKG